MNMKLFNGLLCCLVVACGMDTTVVDDEMVDPEPEKTGAEVRSVSVTGTENNFTFTVEVKSPDTGCDQYADWWEVLTPDSILIYRRILTHSHVSEQPFKRSGGPVAITSDQAVIVRAHMNNLGYGATAMQGSVGNDFVQKSLDDDFAQSLMLQDPLPGDCPN